jgi:predicted secreted Zn-dependent protease
VLDTYPAGVEGRTSVTYYDVQGRTYAELHADMRRLGPKIYGSSFVGETRSPMTWSWRTQSATGGSCSLRDIRVRVNAEILLPRWTPPADADSNLVAEWKRFIAALETHEAGHKDISARAGRDLKDQLRGLTGLCSQVGMRANDIARRIIDEATQAQKRYDAETRHGLTQGTGFGRAPAVVSGMRADSAAERIRRLDASSGVPVVPPDSLPSDLTDSTKWASGGTYYNGTILREIILVRFRPGTSQADRQAAIDLVHGVVAGGRRFSATTEGLYLIRIPTDGTINPLIQAVSTLQALPQVSSADVDEIIFNAPT